MNFLIIDKQSSLVFSPIQCFCVNLQFNTEKHKAIDIWQNLKI